MRFLKALKWVKKRIYLDYAAATPVHPSVVKAMAPYFSKQFGNPSAIHSEGRIGRNAIEEARKDIASLLHVRKQNITFTSGGTESNNLAILGIIETLQSGGRAYDDMEIITTCIEHPSVLQAIERLEKKGVGIQYASVDEDGLISRESFEEALTEKTVLVAISYINSEIGTVQDVKKISHTIRKYNQENDTSILLLLDAAQAPLWLSCRPDALGVDLMTFDGGKCYGPKGVGVLMNRSRIELQNQTFGGSQEGGLRAGTENTPLIVGMSVALVRSLERTKERSKRATILRNEMIAMLLEAIPEAVLNGSQKHRAPNNINISIPGFDSEFAVVTLDVAGIAASTRSACSGADGSGSYVVREIADEVRALSTIRFTLGEETTRRDLKKTVSVLKKHIDVTRTFQVPS